MVVPKPPQKRQMRRPRPNTGSKPNYENNKPKTNKNTEVFNLNTPEGYKRYLEHQAVSRAWAAAGEYEWASEAAHGSSAYLTETSTRKPKNRNPMYMGVSTGAGKSGHVKLQQYVDRGYTPERLAKLLELDLQAVEDNLSGLNVMPRCFVAARIH